MNSQERNRQAMAEEIIGKTQSVCPVCLTKIPAERVRVGNEVYLRKSCQEHGTFTTIIWRGKPDYLFWYQAKSAVPPKTALTKTDKGCPFDCGLCPNHRQQSCCVLLEVTQGCNLHCPICFADAGIGPRKDPTAEELKQEMLLLWSMGKCNLQLSGGEPTVRDDLPELIAVARSIGFTFIQLNTNGIRLAEEQGYAESLKKAGLSAVFLQFDGTNDDIYTLIRGRSLIQVKAKAIEACAQAKLGVVLVPTLVPGINTHQIGEIVRYALNGMPIIRGVHFQPISYFGRYPQCPAAKDRITLPEVMAALEEQTKGLIKIADFAPSGCEHSLCSFHGDFIVQPDGSLLALHPKQNDCTCTQGGGNSEPVVKARDYVATRWKISEPAECCSSEKSWDDLLATIRNNRLSITCMAFQDAENLDLERLQVCCVHILDKGKVIPFCAYNLSSLTGESLYRKQSSLP